jgi:hypothetical protein
MRIIPGKDNAQPGDAYWAHAIVEGELSSALLWCPGCGEMGRLDAHHVHPDGRVTPTVACGCGWRDDIALGGWRGGDKPPGMPLEKIK